MARSSFVTPEFCNTQLAPSADDRTEPKAPTATNTPPPKVTAFRLFEQIPEAAVFRKCQESSALVPARMGTLEIAKQSAVINCETCRIGMQKEQPTGQRPVETRLRVLS